MAGLASVCVQVDQEPDLVISSAVMESLQRSSAVTVMSQHKMALWQTFLHSLPHLLETAFAEAVSP